MATPLVRLPVPTIVVPFTKLTAPVGVPAPVVVDVTVAVNVTGCPKVMEVFDAVNAVEVAAFTVSDTAVEVLVLKLASPSYLAVSELAPSGSAVVVRIPTPLLSVPEPSAVVPLKKSTVPVGVPPPGLTGAIVAVSVTVAPTDEGFGETASVVVVDACETARVIAGEVLAL